MAAPIPASLKDIWPLIVTQLVTVTGLDSSRVRTVARGKTPRLQGDRDLLLRPGQPDFDPGFDHGAGRVCQIIRRPLLVTVRTRLGLDLSDQDADWLLDATLGHVTLEESVLNALVNFWPTDGSGNVLTQEVLHPIDYPAEEKQEGQASDWGETRMAFMMTYEPILNPAY